jgi:peroxiredoxin
MRTTLNFFGILAVLATANAAALAQSRQGDIQTSRAYSPDESSFRSPFTGTWTYRSFRSDPDLSTPIEQLLFGAGTLKLSHPAFDRVSGTLGGEGWQLTLTGGATYGNPATIRFQGKGMIGDEQWVYDYLGYLVPTWPNGESQRPAIVGTIVRTVPHSNGAAKAGYVAQWIAVKQDAAAAEQGKKRPADEGVAVESNMNGLDVREPASPTARPTALGLDDSRGREMKVTWTLQDVDGMQRRVEEFHGRPAVLVFSKGFECSHCAEQINVISNFARQFSERSANVVFIVSDSAESLRRALGIGSTRHVFLADPRAQVLELYGRPKKEFLHGVIVLDASGRVSWKQISQEPITNIQVILGAIDSACAKSVMAPSSP